MTTPAELRRRAKAMRREPTEAERRLWAILRAKRLEGLKFKRQAPIGPYIADFVCFELRMVVEADGGQHADSDYDARRDAWFAASGFLVLRFWNNDILQEPDGVADRILDEAGRLRG